MHTTYTHTAMYTATVYESYVYTVTWGGKRSNSLGTTRPSHTQVQTKLFPSSLKPKLEVACTRSGSVPAPSLANQST